MCLTIVTLSAQTKEYHRVQYFDYVIFEDTTLADSAIYGPYWDDIYEEMKHYAENIRPTTTEYFEHPTPWGTPYLYTLHPNGQDTVPLRQYISESAIVRIKKVDLKNIDLLEMLLDSLSIENAKDMYLAIYIELCYTYTGKLYKATLKHIIGTPELVEQRMAINYEPLLNIFELKSPTKNGKYPVQGCVVWPSKFGERQDYPIKDIK